MNPEVLLTYISSLKLVVVVLLAFIYSRAGRGWRWFGWKVRRKVVLPIILITALIGFSLWTNTFTWKLLIASLISLGVLIAVMHVGYGDGNFRRLLRKIVRNETAVKVVQRAVVGTLYGGACLPVAYITGNWIVYGLSVLVSCSTSVALGVFNPIDAATEETLIGATEFLFPLFL